jgi:hypothetical protein
MQHYRRLRACAGMESDACVRDCSVADAVREGLSWSRRTVRPPGGSPYRLNQCFVADSRTPEARGRQVFGKSLMSAGQSAATDQVTPLSGCRGRSSRIATGSASAVHQINEGRSYREDWHVLVTGRLEQLVESVFATAAPQGHQHPFCPVECPHAGA